MQIVDWMQNNWDTLVSIAAFVAALIRALKAGSLNKFLVSKIEVLATKEDREAIKADAIKARVQNTLKPVVDKVTKGKSGNLADMFKGFLPLLLVGLAFSGCATGEAGRSSAPASGIAIYGNHNIVKIEGDANAHGTAAPESQATQTNSNTTDLKADANLTKTP